MLSYLCHLFDKGLEYRTINVHRSTLSAYHKHIDGKAVGQHPKIVQLMSGVFYTRPPQPKYCFIWDVNTVLDYIKQEWADKSLCIYQCLTDCLNISGPWRTVDKSQLLLGIIKPHNPVASCSVARWLKDVLSQAGINTNVFSAHSTRSASTEYI